MKRKTWVNRMLQERGWVLGSAVVLLLSSGGLALLAQQTRANVVTLLLTLYLASWSYVLGIVGLVLLPVLELIGWLRVHMKQAAMSRYAPAEPRPGRASISSAEYGACGSEPIVPAER